MPILLPLTVLFGSFGAIVFIISRRLSIVNQILQTQKELEAHSKKMVMAKRKKKHLKQKALKELEMVSEQKHQALRNLGLINELLKKVDHDLTAEKPDEALQTLVQILSLDSNHRKANELMAELSLRSGQHKKAEILYKKLVGLYPFDPQYYGALGQSYFQRHQFSTAVKYFEKALEIDKNNPLRYIDLGHVAATRREFSTALSYYLRAHRLNLRDVALMFRIVEMCLQNSDPITAREYLHKILDYEPYNQQAKTLLGEVLRTLGE